MATALEVFTYQNVGRNHVPEEAVTGPTAEVIRTANKRPVHTSLTQVGSVVQDGQQNASSPLTEEARNEASTKPKDLLVLQGGGAIACLAPAGSGGPQCSYPRLHPPRDLKRSNIGEPQHKPGPSTSGHFPSVKGSSDHESKPKINKIKIEAAKASGSGASAASPDSSDTGADRRDKKPAIAADGVRMIGNIQVVPRLATTQERQRRQWRTCDSFSWGRNRRQTKQTTVMDMKKGPSQIEERARMDAKSRTMKSRSDQGIGQEVDAGNTSGAGEDTNGRQSHEETVLGRLPEVLGVNNLPTQNHLPAARTSEALKVGGKRKRVTDMKEVEKTNEDEDGEEEPDET